MAKHNPHTGSNFDDFLKEENLFEEVHAKAFTRALAEQIEDGIQAAPHQDSDGREDGHEPFATRPRAGSR